MLPETSLLTNIEPANSHWCSESLESALWGEVTTYGVFPQRPSLHWECPACASCSDTWHHHVESRGTARILKKLLRKGTWLRGEEVSGSERRKKVAQRHCLSYLRAWVVGKGEWTGQARRMCLWNQLYSQRVRKPVGLREANKPDIHAPGVNVAETWCGELRTKAPRWAAADPSSRGNQHHLRESQSSTCGAQMAEEEWVARQILREEANACLGFPMKTAFLYLGEINLLEHTHVRGDE